jgi:hypothetical protein
MPVRLAVLRWNTVVSTTVLATEPASTEMPVAELATMLFMMVGPALSATEMPTPRAVDPPYSVLFTMRPKGTDPSGLPVPDPSNRIPPPA